MNKISVLGAGSWGLALGLLLNEKDNKVTFWCHTESEADDLSLHRENRVCLPGKKIPPDIEITSNIEEAVKDKDIIVFAVPSKAIRSTTQLIKPYVEKNTIIVNVSKGIEEETLLRLSEVINTEVDNDVVVLSGPSHAEEVARHVPTTVTVSGKNMDAALKIQDTFMTKYFRVYTTEDTVGVELGGALKNVIALAAGAAEGLGYGDNTKAALITRGIAEMSRLGVAMGGSMATLGGLSGIGDLIVTCTSGHSRNRRAGELIAQGNTLDETLKKINMVVEGVPATRAAYALKKKYDIDMPITEAVYKSLFENEPVRESITALMLRDKKTEEI
ncbi:MAG: glycerol-3-phosphate dehydrogenase [Epulopiscium sp. Nele67-Bin004]|nr:MAG: glycerol-3-phosphate dehydrogenase [Epulopiscium sp. Nele67-Bin004]